MTTGYKNQLKNLKSNKAFLLTKTAVVLFFCATFFLLEPQFRDKLIFAVTYFDSPTKICTPNTQKSSLSDIEKVEASTHQQKSRAPEPSTFFLFLSGLGGLIVRFAKRSFDKFKRITDFCLAIFGLTVASPILIFAAILIRINSRGPVVYRQNRVGLNGKIFKIYKLRSMRIDAEKGTGAVWAKKNDPRITSVGRVLRKTHIDEIPQLFNVLKGEMSIVGPRPERPEIVRDLKTIICDYEKRLNVKPGITGFAQVWHKYDESIQDVRKKIKFDLLYIRKMCLLVDLRIMGRTVISVATGRGAN